MRKFSLVVLVVLLALSATSVARAQDMLPWGAYPGGNTDTQEFHTRTQQAVGSGLCIQFDFSLTVAPKSIRAFVQSGNNRYSIEVLPLLTLAVVGPHSICIKLEQLGLENPTNGAVDHTSPFDPSIGTISDLGIHVWDETHQVSLVVNGIGLVNNADAHPGPSVAEIPLAVLPAASKPNNDGTRMCIEQALVVAELDHGKVMTQFKGDFSAAVADVLVVDNGSIKDFDATWTFIEGGGFAVGLVDYEGAASADVTRWFVVYVC